MVAPAHCYIVAVMAELCAREKNLVGEWEVEHAGVQGSGFRFLLVGDE